MAKKKLKGYERVAMIIQAGKEYAYALYDKDINVKDEVLVTGRASHDTWTISRILKANDASIANISITEEIICKIDTSAYRNRVKMREKEAELKRKIATTRRSLQEKIYDLITGVDDEYLDKLDPEYKKLRKQLETLQENMQLEKG